MGGGMTNYNDGKWHGWNGGECPVHPETIVQVQSANETRIQVEDEGDDWICAAGEWEWEHDGGMHDIIAFRVIKEYREPREWWLVHSQGCAVGLFTDEGTAQLAADGCHEVKITHVREVME